MPGDLRKAAQYVLDETRATHEIETGTLTTGLHWYAGGYYQPADCPFCRLEAALAPTPEAAAVHAAIEHQPVPPAMVGAAAAVEASAEAPWIENAPAGEGVVAEIPAATCAMCGTDKDVAPRDEVQICGPCALDCRTSAGAPELDVAP